MPTLLQPSQTILFLGDYTSPDDPGYVGIMRAIIARFYPKLNPNLIIAGSQGQTARGLRSSALMQIIQSSKPDWLVVGIGLTDALREPAARNFLQSAEHKHVEREAAEVEATFGPELRVQRSNIGPTSDVGREPVAPPRNVDAFQADLASALKSLEEVGVRCVVLTTVLGGHDLHNPINVILRAYNRAVRAATTEARALLIDVEKAYKDILDRATNYKQMVALASPTGVPNAQGQALLARTVLNALGVLPQPGYRPLR